MVNISILTDNDKFYANELFNSIDEFVDWDNNKRPHMALDWYNLDYYNAYIRKMPKDNIVIDKQSFVYEVKKE